jgi:hypothetical protein
VTPYLRRYLGCIPLALVAACSGIKTYQNGGPRNVLVRTDASKVNATLGIYDVAPDCRTTYRGTVRLDEASIPVAIPPDRPSYLEVRFASSSFFGGSTSSSFGTLLKPHPGYGYELRVTYRDDIYSVALRETDPRKSSSRELPRRSLDSCRPS